MTTAIIGVGNIGKTVARHLVNGGEQIVLAASEEDAAKSVADELGELATSATVSGAIAVSDVVLFAVWFDVIKQLIAEHGPALAGKVVVDPSNPIAIDDQGNVSRTLPGGISSGSVIANLLPAGAHFVKAFGTLTADSLASASNRSPRRAVLFYATDDSATGPVVEQLINAAGFDPVRAGGVDASLRIEVFGDLHQMGGLDGKLLDADEASHLAAR